MPMHTRKLTDDVDCFALTLRRVAPYKELLRPVYMYVIDKHRLLITLAAENFASVRRLSAKKGASILVSRRILGARLIVNITDASYIARSTNRT
jgi:hypothetical protein